MRRKLIIFIAILPLLIFSLTSLAIANRVYITQSGYIGALSKASLNRAMTILNSGDKQAFYNYVNSNPVVFFLSPGLSVYLEDSSWGLIKIRRVGKTISIWTFREAVK